MEVKNKKLVVFRCIIMSLSVILIANCFKVVVYSNSLTELEIERELIDEKARKLSREAKKKEKEVYENKRDLDNVHEEIKVINKELNLLTIDITEVKTDINDKAYELEGLHELIITTERKMNLRNEILKERLRKMQVKERTVSFLDALLNATNIQDLIGRFSATITLLEADRELIERQSEDFHQLQSWKSIVVEKLEEQRVNSRHLQAQQSALDKEKDGSERTFFHLQESQEFLERQRTDIAIAYERAVERGDELEQEILAIHSRQREMELIASEEQIHEQERVESQQQLENISSVDTEKVVVKSPKPNTQKATCSTGINEKVYFSNFESVGALTGKGQAIIDIANEYNIDPVLMAAITFHETGFGKSNAIKNYNNPGGIMNPATNWSKLIRFDSLEDGLRMTAKTINKLVYKGGHSTIHSLGSVYAPVGAANDPTGLNNHWGTNVTKIANDLGGLTANCP